MTTRRCSFCGETGHNVRRCPLIPPDAREGAGVPSTPPRAAPVRRSPRSTPRRVWLPATDANVADVEARSHSGQGSSEAHVWMQANSELFESSLGTLGADGIHLNMDGVLPPIPAWRHQDSVGASAQEAEAPHSEVALTHPHDSAMEEVSIAAAPAFQELGGEEQVSPAAAAVPVPDSQICFYFRIPRLAGCRTWQPRFRSCRSNG